MVVLEVDFLFIGLGEEERKVNVDRFCFLGLGFLVGFFARVGLVYLIVVITTLRFGLLS